MAASEAEAEPEPEPEPAGPAPPSPPGTERALEEAAASGSLSLAGRRLRLFPGGAARRWDLSDTTQADLSRNRFAEVPEDACQLVALEGLSLYHNCLRSIPPAIANLEALTYLNLSRNQLTSLPACLCRLPLKVLIASNNKLGALPDETGSLSCLRQLDVSCNELQALPASVGQLLSLRDLNVRRNQLSALPEELSELPLIRLDFSCNRVTRIPVCYRRLRHLQTVLLDNNPLQSPPAQICLKGKIHIFKYLNIEACSKTGPDLAELARASRPTGFSTCLSDEFFPLRQYGGLDSGFNSVDSGSKRWSGNESADEFSDLSFRIAELVREPRQPKEKRDRAADGDPEQIDFIDSSAEEEAKPEGVSQAEEKRKAERSLPQTADVGDKAPDSRLSVGSSPPREEPPGEERRRPETLQIWRERERQQALEKQDSLRRVVAKGGPGDAQGLPNSNGRSESSSLAPRKPRTQATEPPPGAPSPTSPGQRPRQLEPLPSQVCSPPGREPGSAQKPSSFLFRSASRGAGQLGLAPAGPPPDPPPDPLRLRSSSHDLDERELTAQLRKALESRLGVRLAEDLGEALADGAVLCQLANHLRPRSVPFIHVPSPAVPKLSAPKRRKNVENFLEACRRMGVPEETLCQPQHVLSDESLAPLALTLRALLRAAPPQTTLPRPDGGSGRI